MTKLKSVAAASATIVFIACSASASAQTTSSTKLIDLRSDRSLANGDAIVKRAKAYVNPLDPPSISRITLESSSDVLVKGVMTEEGPVHEVDSVARAFGSFGVPYTTTRVQEGIRSVESQDTNRLSTTYPYRTVGRLTFQIGADSFHCSASIILSSIMVTAAHCVQDVGSGDNAFTNFEFRPGHYGADDATAAQIAPYGAWEPVAAVVATSWSDGTDPGCGPTRENDVAVMALAKDANGEFIGNIVGSLGYGWNNFSFVTSALTGDIETGAVTTLGYPGLMDAGVIMQRVDGPGYPLTADFCDDGSSLPQIYQGSNLTGGSSGGPWVANFSGQDAVLSGGAVVGDQASMAVVGVTSWGATDPNDVKNNFSSQFAQNSQFPDADYGGFGAGNIGALVNSVCSSEAPEGGTLASQGYCD